MNAIDLSEYEVVYRRPEALTDVFTHYCPGCTHGLIHRLVGEVIDELGIRERTICVAPVGCAVFAYNYFNTDACEAAHGRAPAMATGLKRIQPDKVVFTYQGDGDLAAIGTNEIIHAASRGESLTVIFVNNANYGMTGGQMAPTTLSGQVTTSSPYGRDVKLVGLPMHVAELMSSHPWHGLCRAAVGARCRQHQQDQGRHPHGVPGADGRAGTEPGGGTFLLPDQLAHEPGRRPDLDRRGHDADLPAGRLQGGRGGPAFDQAPGAEAMNDER